MGERKYERVRFRAPIGVHVYELPLLEARGYDLSAGGLCIVLPNPGTPPFVSGDQITFRVQLDKRRFSDIVAEVRYVVPTNEGTLRVGLEWVGVDAGERSMLERFVSGLRDPSDFRAAG